MSVQRSVLDAALEIIAADGPDAVSMREVARRAGVSHQAPYHHFTDRAGIFAAISAEGFLKLAAEVRTMPAHAPNPARSCFEAYLRVAMTNPGHFRVMFRGDLCGLTTHAEVKAAADQSFNELLRMVERTIGRPVDDAAALTWATLMWSTTHGFATLLIDFPLARRLPPGLSLEQHIDDVVELMGEMAARQAASMGVTPIA
jgi:AcrR family transcriptional regulator